MAFNLASDFTPTQEQLDAVSAAVDTTDNLLIKALAGAAKTTTLVMIAKALSGTSILCLAFNKKIAVEMAERLPANCQSQTMNSLGHRAWGYQINKRLIVNKDKMGDILKAMIATLDDEEMKKTAWERLGDFIKATSFMKQCGYIPDGYGGDGYKGQNKTPLIGDAGMEAHFETIWEEWEWAILREACKRSLDAAWQGDIDYDDQVLMPVVFPCQLSQYPVVLVDEAQDLSSLNHAMLRKLVKKGRIIAVGDPCQAIYGFRGAHQDSMDLLKLQFNMTELHLNISFRCPIAVVEHARFRAPQMQYPDWAKQGSVTSKLAWDETDLPNDAAVICRNNAPLFKLAIKLLQRGKYAQVVGNDMAAAMVKRMKKLGPPSMSREDALARIGKWEEKEKAKTKSPANIMDQAECMRIFVAQGETLGHGILYAEHVLNSDGPIKLMTGHKSKGLEFKNVFFLDSDLLSDEGQDINLRYVIITRTKETLTYIYSAGFDHHSVTEEA